MKFFQKIGTTGIGILLFLIGLFLFQAGAKAISGWIGFVGLLFMLPLFFGGGR